jgi:hypothetical protein
MAEPTSRIDESPRIEPASYREQDAQPQSQRRDKSNKRAPARQEIPLPEIGAAADKQQEFEDQPESAGETDEEKHKLDTMA